MTQERWTEVDRYLDNLLLSPDPVLEAALEASSAAGLPTVNVAPNQGKLLHLLVLACGARTVLEIGTLGGYSTIWLARSLPSSGRLVSLETDPRHAAVARENIARAGLSDIVEIVLGPALETLPRAQGPAPATLRPRVHRCRQAVHRGVLRLVPGDVTRRDCDHRRQRGSWRAGLRARKRRSATLKGMRRFLDKVAVEPRVSATAVQTVGMKGYDGFLLAVVTSPAG